MGGPHPSVQPPIEELVPITAQGPLGISVHVLILPLRSQPPYKNTVSYVVMEVKSDVLACSSWMRTS
jgi:hypothetical protein